MALDLVGFGIVLPILPLYARRFGATPFTATALVATFSGAQLVFSPVWGRVSDRIGRKPVLVLSLAGTAVGSLVTGLAGSLWVLFLGRLIDGVSGASVSVAQASVADVAPPDQRAKLLGLLGAAFGLGFVAGPAIGALAALGGPHVPFLLAAGIAGVNAVAAWRRLPETHPSLGERGRGRAMVRRAVDPVPWRRDGVAALVAVAFVSLAAFSAFEGTFALFGERRLGLRLASTGGVFAAIGVALVLVQVRLLPAAVDRLGEVKTLRLGLVLDAAGLAALATVHSFAALAPALFFLVVGQGLVSPTLSSILAGKVDADRRGGVLGVQQAAGGLARVVGPLAGGFLFQQAGVPVPYVAGAALMLLAALLALRPGVATATAAT
ncbi:MAG: transporter, family, tetracycline resistance protein [Acidimicrobiaceae bacterium]|nr:transporter, family, tetracycline resistance protein [Acidimicrobiaceae bacterium]